MTAEWAPRHYFSSAQRLFFSVGAVVLMLASFWWAAVLAGWMHGSALPATGVHALAMTFGFFPMFFAGFIFSVGAKWLKVSPISTKASATVALLHLAGWLGFASCTVLALETGPSVSLALVALSLWAQVWLLVRMVLRSEQDDRLHGWLFSAAAVAGAVLLAVCIVRIALQQWAEVRELASAAVWSYVGLTFLTAAHRMVAFISGTPFKQLDARAPNLVLRVLGTALLLSAGGELGLVSAMLVDSVRAAVGVVLLVFALRWPFVQSLRPRLLQMLYAGFAWLTISLLLSALGVLGVAGTADLHAFTVGFLGTVMLAMLSRVIAGQGGVTVVADNVLWGLFAVQQAAAATRVLGSVALAPFAVELASLLWALVWTLWVVRYGVQLGQLKQR